MSQLKFKSSTFCVGVYIITATPTYFMNEEVYSSRVHVFQFEINIVELHCNISIFMSCANFCDINQFLIKSM
jgi:hypothetical protein